MKHILSMAVILLMLGAALGYAAAQKLPFSPARTAGNTLYLSGQIPKATDGTLVRGDVGEQTRQVMANIGSILKENGYTFDDVVKMTVFLKDIEDYTEMNAAYRTFFSERFPARECVGGLQIVAGLDVEISAIAHKK